MTMVDHTFLSLSLSPSLSLYFSTLQHTHTHTNDVSPLTLLHATAENHIKIVREGALPYLVRLLQSGNHKIQEQAAGTLRNLAVNGTYLCVCVTVSLC